MRYLKKFERFTSAEPEVSPVVKPTTTPSIKPGKPSPFRRIKPSVEPAPKASAEDVAKRFVSLMDESGEDVKKYID